MVKDTQSEIAGVEGDTTAVVATQATEIDNLEQASAQATADVTSGAEADAAAETVAAAEVVQGPATPSWADMTQEERFRATTKLIFIAPDVPPIQPRPRRSELNRLDDIFDRQLDRQFDRHAPNGSQTPQGSSSSHQPRGEEQDQREQSSNSRRRRQRNTEAPAEEEQSRRPARQAPVVSEPQRLKGSTRLEAKKQRRRDGRDAGRRRTVITESEFLARRESVDRQMIVRTTADRVQIGVLEDRVLVEHYVARSSENSIIGNVYLGRVQNVLPSMEAAFVDIGRGRNAVLYSGEVDWSEFEGSHSARRIENALKPGDQVLVQVTKDPVGHKGARLTSQISLPGRFLVYVPGGAMNGISRKLPDTERARLKKILKEVLPSGAGVIVRTAAEGATEEQLTHDVQRLARQWESIQKRTEKGGGPTLLHSEPDMLIKIIRDVFNEDFHRLVISGADTYRVIEDYLTQVAPDLMQRVERYEGERDVFSEYRVTEQIAKALDRKVWLPSGGSLVIDRTEAMTVVDVNTGKFVGSGGNLEETVTKNNLEAAEEIVRQLRLRDVGGIIVIDFIDMVLESNRDLVLRRLVECLSRDRTKHQVAEVTSLGLVQMTRKKLGLGLLESFSDACEVCAGRGVIVQHEPVVKHRSESSGRSSRRGKGQQQAPQPSQPQAQAAQVQAQDAPQAHAISDGAKNMLAQVAASTLHPVAQDAPSVDQPELGGSAVTQSDSQSPRVPRRASRSAGSTVPKVESQSAGSAQAQVNAPAASKGSAPEDLLSSLLDALPESPAAGTGRSRARRTAGTRSNVERVPARESDAAIEAKQALAAALAETSRRAASTEE